MLVALPLIVFAVAVIVVGGLVFALAMALIGAVCLHELFRVLRRAKPLAAAGTLWVVGLILIAYVSDRPEFHLVMAAAGGFLVLFLFALVETDRRGVVWSMATTVFGVAWIGIPLVHAVLLRELDPHGASLVVNVAVGTFAADTAAYLGGRSFGTKPLAPSISPGKTVEGTVIGILGGALAVVFASLYQDWLPAGQALVLGLAIASIAPLGDLFESMVKRDAGTKDTSRLLGPHGGMLDRLDAILFAIVVGYYVSVAYGGFAG